MRRTVVLLEILPRSSCSRPGLTPTPLIPTRSATTPCSRPSTWKSAAAATYTAEVSDAKRLGCYSIRGKQCELHKSCALTECAGMDQDIQQGSLLSGPWTRLCNGNVGPLAYDGPMPASRKWPGFGNVRMRESNFSPQVPSDPGYFSQCVPL